MIPKRLVLFSCACLTAVMLWPAEAAAQRRPVHRPPPRTQVVVSAGFYRPYYYRPYYYSGFYSPFYSSFYSPFYSPFYGAFYAAGWYPYYAQYGGGYYGGGYYGRSWASARIEVKPRQAQVFVDGYYVGVVDQFDGVFQRLDVPTGEHELAVYLQGYRTYREKTLFRPGEGYHFKAVLEPIAAGAAPEPAPKPSGTGPDPYRDPRDPNGGMREPYRPPQDQNPPYPGDQREPRDPGRTRPLPEPSRDRRAPESREFGSLNVRVQPADAVIVIDGERWDSPDGGSRLLLQLAAGRHRVEVRKDGFKPYSATVDIRPGEEQALNISLPPGGGH